MKFKLGEFVRFVDEPIEGYVTRIIDEDMVGVTGDDDFEIPVLASKITRVHGQHREEKESTTEQENKPVGEFKAAGVFLAAIPDPRKGSIAHFHLVNETSYQLLVSLRTEKEGQVKGEFAGILAPESSEQVYSASLAELGLWPIVHIQIMYYSKHNFPLKEPLAIAEKFRAKDFAGEKKAVPVIRQQGWLFRLDEDKLKIDPIKLKESFYKLPEEKKQIEAPPKEVDLHIERLRDDYQFLSKSEILNIQLQHFKKMLDAAIVHRQGSIIFIHGVGNGTLRHEIHKALSKHQQVKTFIDARKEKFGYGATEVVLK